MKYLLILLFFISLGLQAQISQTPRGYPKSEAWKTIGLYSGSILLNAVGDGLNDSGNKGWGHACNATSIGVLLISPKLMDYEKKKWGWYIASYVGLRIGLFDYTYNAVRGLPVNKIGNTSWWDKGLQKVNPPNTYMGRAVFFIVGFSIPFNTL